MIPRVFHQIWLGDSPFPDEFRNYQTTWLAQNPGWELRLWTEDDLPDDLVRREIYERLRKPAERADLLRLEVLLRAGGVYIDTDFECLRPLEPLLEGVSFFCAYTKPPRVNNAIMGSVPGHPLLERAIAEARPRTMYGIDKEGTGPLLLTRLIQAEDGITIFDSNLFFPRTKEEQRTAVAVHRQARSWKDREMLLRDLELTEQKLERARAELRAERERHEQTRRELAAAASGRLRAAARSRAVLARAGRRALGLVGGTRSTRPG